MNSGLIYDVKPSVHAYIETSRLHRPDMRLCHTQPLRPGHTGQTEGLRMDRVQFPTFARVLRDLEGCAWLCVTCNLSTNHVRIA